MHETLLIFSIIGIKRSLKSEKQLKTWRRIILILERTKKNNRLGKKNYEKTKFRIISLKIFKN